MVKNLNKRLYLILGIAFALRVWGIGFGPYHPDEPMVVNQALSFGAGNPFSFAYYYYPPFFHYILFLAYALFYVIGWIIGPFRNPDNFLFLVLVKQFPFYLIGRFLTALIGTATIIPVYLIVKRMRSDSAALLAALFMSCMYLHVRNSHYCTVDVPMTFMAVLSYVYVLKIVQNDDIKNYILAGVMAGLAIATKYNAVILIPCIAIASLTHFSDKESRYRNIQGLTLCLICVAIAFLIVCSYCIWDRLNFLKDANILYNATKNRNVSLWYRFKVNLNYGLGLPLEILGALGFVYLIFKKRKAGLVLAAFPFLFFLTLIKAGQAYSRYVLPVIPFFAISAGIISQDVLESITAKFKFKKILFYFIISSIIIYPLTKSLYMDYLLSKPDVRDLARNWIYKNIPFGSKIAIDDPQYSPQLFPTKGQLDQKLNDLTGGKGRDLKKRRLELLANLKSYPIENYQIYYLGKLLAEFSLHTPAISRDRKSILDNDIEYIVTNDLDFNGDKNFYDSLHRELDLVYQSSPFREKAAANYSKYPYSHIPIDDTLFDMRYNGIGIKIFKIQK